jgi:hypothetical protein
LCNLLAPGSWQRCDDRGVDRCLQQVLLAAPRAVGSDPPIYLPVPVLIGDLDSAGQVKCGQQHCRAAARALPAIERGMWRVVGVAKAHVHNCARQNRLQVRTYVLPQSFYCGMLRNAIRQPDVRRCPWAMAGLGPRRRGSSAPKTRQIWSSSDPARRRADSGW